MTNVANSIRAVATGLLVGVCWAALFGYIGRTLRATYPDEMHDPLWWEAIATISKALQYVVPGVVTGYFSRSKPMAMGALVCFLLAVMLNTYGGTTYLAMEWSAAGGMEAWVMVLATGIAYATIGACAAHAGSALRSNPSLERP